MSTLRSWTHDEDLQLINWTGTYSELGKKLNRTAAACRARKQTLTTKEPIVATSSKVQFKLETLKEKALESIDLRIQQAQRDVDSYTSPEALAERHAEWREAQESKVAALAIGIDKGDVDDYQLSKFKIDPIPDRDDWDRREAGRRLASLEVKRSLVIAKSESLVGDDEGNIALTKTQLAEFFGL